MEKIFNTGYTDLKVISISSLGNDFYIIELNKIEETIVHKSKIHLQISKGFNGKLYHINDIMVDKVSYEMVKSILKKS